LKQHNYKTLCVDKLDKLLNMGEKYSVVYADPPWLYSNQGTRSSTKNHYVGMSIEELCELPIRELSNDDSFLHLWTTNAFLFESKRVMDAWGYNYKSACVWVKPQMGIGNYWRVSHEFLLLGKRGSPKWANKGLMSWYSFRRTKHSAKPEQFRKMIEATCIGPYLELFGRRPANNWVVWGDEIERNMFEGSIACL